jgi:cytochrome c-type biogenesis protein CcmF
LQNFIGENLVPGKLGHLFVILSFVSTIVASIAYFVATQLENKERAQEAISWRQIGKSAFIIHGTSIFMVFGILFMLIFQHRYEYHYVWSHSNNLLPFKYLLSCFWEGQQGSFLLWLIWHVVLGTILVFKSKKWEAPVMFVLCAVQIILSATLLGFVFGDITIGSSPFTLLRHAMAGAPIFEQENYLSFIKDGNGLNPLLQNYWMVIHPPVLFLGFASTIVPFAYSIAGLWRKQFTDWTLPALQWSIFGVMILGAGIMMGGAWAYESLNFGGYWAWDPVENASLVPWLTLVAGLHTLNIYKNSGYSLKSTLVFFILSFFLIIYSTYLTRTGILGDTSVHAFTGEGASLSIHLILFLALIAIGSFGLYFVNARKIEAPQKEEATWSREFWMYIGSLVLLISAVQITFTTSIPVWNKMVGLKLAPPPNPMEHYNTVQIWVAILIVIGTAFTFYLKYKDTDIKKSLRSQVIPLVIALLLSVFIGYTQKINSWQPIVLLFASAYGIVGNIAYLIKIKSKVVTKWGAMIAHAGFSVMMLGVLLSSFNKHVISFNKLAVDLGLDGKDELEKKRENRENVLLFINTPVDMDEYRVTYKGDSVVPPNHYYLIDYEKRNPLTNKLEEHFVLYPNAQINPKMGLVSSPGTKHYWNKDIFTYISKAIDKTTLQDTMNYTRKTMRVGDTLFFSNGMLVYRGLDTRVTNPNYMAMHNDIAVSAKLEAYNLNGKTGEAQPVYYIRDKTEFQVEDTLKDYNLFVKLAKLNLDTDKSVDIEFKQPAAANDYIVMKALVFPHINLVWLGTILTVIGSFIALIKRIRQTKV